RTPSGAVMSRAVRIGTWPSISLADARKRAHDLAGQVARGRDPARNPDPFAPLTPDPHCPDRLARTALAVDLPRRWRVIPADRSDFARSGLPMAVNQREQHAALQTTPAAPGRGEIYKRRGISIFHCGFGQDVR